MSLGREIQDFVGTFNSTFRTGIAALDAKSKRDYYANKGSGGLPTNLSDPKAFRKAYAGSYGSTSYGQLPSAGSGGAIPSQAAAPDSSPGPEDTSGPQPQQEGFYAEGGLVTDPRDLGPQEEYTPPSAIPVGDMQAPARPAIPTPAPAAPVAPRGALPLNDQTRTAAYNPDTDGPLPAGVTPQTVAPAAPAIAPDVPVDLTRNVNTPSAGAGGSSNNASADFTAALDGGLKYATHTFHLDNKGALPGTEDRHHAGGVQALLQGTGAATPDMVKQMNTVVNGAPLPQKFEDEAIWGIRRLEAIYNFYSQNGKTNEANKAAFELMQFSAGMAAKYGQTAMQQLHAGDTQGAVNSIIGAHNFIPDGRKMVPGPNNTVQVVDAKTGQVADTFPTNDPKLLFSAALGLSNRSMYWDVIMQRAAGGKGGGTQKEADTHDLARARIKLMEARTAKAGQPPRGRAGAPAMSAGMQRLIDAVNETDAKAGVKTAQRPQGSDDSGPAPAPAREDTSDEEEPAGEPLEAGGKDTTLTAPASVLRVNPAVPGTAGARTTPAAPVEDPDAAIEAQVEASNKAPNLSAADRTMKLSPEEKNLYQTHLANLESKGGIDNPDGSRSTLSQATIEHDGKVYSVPTVFNGKRLDKREDIVAAVDKVGWDKFPAYATAEEAQARYDKLHGFMEKDTEDYMKRTNPDAVPDRTAWHDGTNYREDAPQAAEKAKPFDREAPDPSALERYKALQLEAAKLTGREGVTARTLINSRIKQFADVQKSYEHDKTAWDKSEVTRVGKATKDALAAQKASTKAEFDFLPKPGSADEKRIYDGVEAALKTTQDTIQDPQNEGKPDPQRLAGTVFGDKTATTAQLKKMAYDLRTSNKHVDGDQAVNLVYQMSRLNTDNPRERAYKPLGKDAIGNVILKVKDGPIVHMRPEAYDTLTAIVAKRADNAMVAARKADEAAKKPGPTIGQTMRWIGNTAPGQDNLGATVQKAGENIGTKLKDLARRANTAPSGGPSYNGKAIDPNAPLMRP